jgi:hypothetical protein
VHALAVQRIWQLTSPARQPEIRERIKALYPRLIRWHRYLATQRDPESSGLVTTFHPWEGTDNSPRWDRALERIKVADPGPYTRLDVTELGDPSQRPTDWDYDRFLWLVEQLRKYRYDDARIYREYPFLIKDVFFSAILVAANAAPLRRPRRPHRGGHPAADVRGIRAAVRAHRGLRPAGRPDAATRLGGLLREPAVSLAAAAEHQPRGAGVRAAQLLARPGLADHQLAAVAVTSAARLRRPRGSDPPRQSGADRRR